ncbi:hypothetical protein [Atlantibacter hermannii]|uniref:hypothetical protein n=1 Tax=Atlantibacter hermannii TaxID=565 RepID=UPI0028A117ED|nr:hypothetical protein [Atlantibacter hermannii]
MYLIDHKVIYQWEKLLILEDCAIKGSSRYRIILHIDNFFRNAIPTERHNFQVPANDRGARETFAYSLKTAIVKAIDYKIGIGGMIEVLPEYPHKTYTYDEREEFYKKAGLWLDIK